MTDFLFKDIGLEWQDGVIDNFEKLVMTMRNHQDRFDEEKELKISPRSRHKA